MTVEVGSEIYEALAVITAGEEREKAWGGGIVESYPFFAEHQTKVAPRRIPVVALAD